MIDRFWKGNVQFENADINKVNEITDILFEKDNKGLSRSKKFYYFLKPLIPRFMQIYFRNLIAKNISENGYNSVEIIYREILEQELKKLNNPFYFIWFWPKGYKMASVITHDVETERGFKKVLKLAGIDEKFGIKSSFEFVPEGYKIDYGIFDELRNRGFEIAVHGLNHDGKLFNSEKMFKERLPKIEKYAEEWAAKGFRSPALLRNPLWMQILNFEWDSSFPDWDPYGPQSGGCRTLFPFFISKKTVELPVTMMQDHTLFEILRLNDINIWQKKIDYIYSLSGLANIIVHPDYIFGNNRLKFYCKYLDYLKSKNDIWHILPREVSCWWTKRDNSSIVCDKNGKPCIKGPVGQEGTIKCLSSNTMH